MHRKGRNGMPKCKMLTKPQTAGKTGNKNGYLHKKAAQAETRCCSQTRISRDESGLKAIYSADKEHNNELHVSPTVWSCDTAVNTLGFGIRNGYTCPL